MGFMNQRGRMIMLLMVGLFGSVVLPSSFADETDSAARSRHERVAERRAGTIVICHRGALEFFHENTLEAYRATFELGADGNEIDIRRTRDGVLVCFHDDMLDHLLDAYGDVSDYDWSELQTFGFRRPGRLGENCRIPTLEQTFELHRRYAGLMHLDIKRPGLDDAIIALLDRMDLWDHVIAANGQNAPAILKHPRYRPEPFKGSLYLDRSEVFPEEIAAMLKKPGKMVMVEDPRGILPALGREIGRPAPGPEPHPAMARRVPKSRLTNEELLRLLTDGSASVRAPSTPAERAAAARDIRIRAEAADEIRRRNLNTPEFLAGLERQVRQRSLHPEWMHHGLDGAAALRALFALRAPHRVELARFCLDRDDPAVEAVANPQYKTPRSWTDFRTKMIVFDLLQDVPGAETEKLCRDYLALSDGEAERRGTLQFEQAARTLLTISPTEETAAELMQHRRREVRGRTILMCVAKRPEAWARRTLEQFAPQALKY
jgi:hypothetical protein